MAPMGAGGINLVTVRVKGLSYQHGGVKKGEEVNVWQIVIFPPPLITGKDDE